MDPAIDRLQRIGAERPDVIGLGGGLPADELFPRVPLSRAFLSAVHKPASGALQYGWPEGSQGLRRWIASRLAARGADICADDVIVTNGAQQAIAVACECLLSAVGEGSRRVAVEAESYPAALDLFRTRGASLVTGVPDVDFVYVMTGVTNPRGHDLAHARKAEILAWNRPIVVDEAYAELRFDGVVPRPLASEAPHLVWSIGTLSKTLCPGLRVGWLVPPRAERERALRVKHDMDLQAGSLAQAVVEEFLLHDDFDARLTKARAFYESRAHRLIRALRRELPGWRFDDPDGGFSVFCETDVDGDDREFLEIATRHGVSFDPGRIFRPTETSSPIALRLCFSACAGPKLEEGVRRLARAWRDFAPRAATRRTPPEQDRPARERSRRASSSPRRRASTSPPAATPRAAPSFADRRSVP